MKNLAIQPGSHYRDRNHVVVLVHGFNPDLQTVTYSPVGFDWEITTALIVFNSRFIRFSL